MNYIYHFLLDHRYGGNFAYAKVIKNGLSDKFTSKIITVGRGPDSDISLLKLRDLSRFLFPIESLLNCLQIISLIIFRKIQVKSCVFHVHGGATIAPILVATLFQIPVVWTIHETTDSYKYFVKLGLSFIRVTKHCLAVVADSCRQAYKGFNNALLAPPGIDGNFWTRSNYKNNHLESPWLYQDGIRESQTLKILTVGNISPIKNVDSLICALDGINIPWSLKVVGMELDTQSEFTNNLKKLAKKIVKNYKCRTIEFLGAKNSVDIRSLLFTSDLFILPSKSEACPIALLEAMAMDSYCLASDVGDVSRMMKFYEFGALFDPNKIDELQKYLMEFASRYEYLHRNTTRVSVRKRNFYTCDELIKVNEKIYINLLCR